LGGKILYINCKVYVIYLIHFPAPVRDSLIDHKQNGGNPFEILFGWWEGREWPTGTFNNDVVVSAEGREIDHDSKRATGGT
jgi:hypothetical protein